jgi:hypothetical protein
VCDDLKVLKVRNWKQLTMDRKAWSDFLRKLKPTKGCNVNERKKYLLLLLKSIVAKP